MNLYEMTSAASGLYELLSNGEIDEQVINDTLAAMGAGEKVESYCKVIKQLEGDAAMYAAEIKRMTDNKRTTENGIKRMKAALLDYLQATGAKKVAAGVFTVSKTSSKAVNVVDIDKLPPEYIRTSREPMKAEIKKAIANGETIEGAELVENESVRVK